MQVLRRVWCLFEIWKTVAQKSVDKLLVLAHEVNLMGMKDIFTKLDVAGTCVCACVCVCVYVYARKTQTKHTCR